MATNRPLTNDDIRRLASPVVVEAHDAIASIHTHADGQPTDVIACLYRMLLMGAVGMLKKAGQSNATIASNLRAYAEMIERGDT